MICLVWGKSKNGGPIRCYTIECRQCNGSNPYGDWMLAATALNNEAKLTNQPIGVKLEYRIKAINSTGESMPSNTISVVL
jgi:hypothetical protein